MQARFRSPEVLQEYMPTDLRCSRGIHGTTATIGLMSSSRQDSNAGRAATGRSAPVAASDVHLFIHSIPHLSATHGSPCVTWARSDVRWLEDHGAGTRGFGRRSGR